VADLSGDFQLVLKAGKGVFVQSDLWADEFEGHLLVKLRICSSVDFAHPSSAELFDNLIAAREGGAGSEFGARGFEGLSVEGKSFGGSGCCRRWRELSAALPAEPLGVRVLGLTLRAFGSHSFPSRLVIKRISPDRESVNRGQRRTWRRSKTVR
jgi:hypothetical protein